MLLQTFLLFQEVVSKSLESCVEFMKVMVPTFCLSMMFASNVSSAAGFYQTAFLVIYLVEWLFLNLLMPLIHIYIFSLVTMVVAVSTTLGPPVCPFAVRPKPAV